MKWIIRLAIVAAIVGVVVLLVTRKQRSPMPEIEYAAPPSSGFGEAAAEAVTQAEVVAEAAAEEADEAMEEADEAMEEADEAIEEAEDS